MPKMVEISTSVELENEILRERLVKGQNPKTRQFVAVLDDKEVGLLIIRRLGTPGGLYLRNFYTSRESETWPWNADSF